MSKQLYRKKPVEWEEINAESWICDYGQVIRGLVCFISLSKTGTPIDTFKTLQEAKNWVEAQRDEMLNQYFEKV